MYASRITRLEAKKFLSFSENKVFIFHSSKNRYDWMIHVTNILGQLSFKFISYKKFVACIALLRKFRKVGIDLYEYFIYLADFIVLLRIINSLHKPLQALVEQSKVIFSRNVLLLWSCKVASCYSATPVSHTHAHTHTRLELPCCRYLEKKKTLRNTLTA